MAKTAPPYLISLHRDHLSLCTPTNPDPVSLKFSATMVNDLEVVGIEDLTTAVKNFIDQKKVKPSPVVFILSDSVYFEKIFSGPTPPSPADIEAFTETVPFSAPSSKLFFSANTYRLVVINRDLYEKLKSVFECFGFTVTAVIPAFSLTTQPLTDLTSQICLAAYKKLDQLIADSFTDTTSSKAVFSRRSDFFMKKNKIWITLFSVLAIGVAIFTAISTLGFMTKKPKTHNSKPITPIAARPTLIPTPTPIATPSAEILKNLTVQITNASGKSGLAATLAAQLKAIGFSKVTTKNSAVTSGNSVVFSPNSATVAGEFILNYLKNSYPDIAQSSNSQAVFDVMISLGKITP